MKTKKDYLTEHTLLLKCLLATSAENEEPPPINFIYEFLRIYRTLKITDYASDLGFTADGIEKISSDLEEMGREDNSIPIPSGDKSLIHHLVANLRIFRECLNYVESYLATLRRQYNEERFF